LNIATPQVVCETALHQQRGRYSYQVLPADLGPVYAPASARMLINAFPKPTNTESISSTGFAYLPAFTGK